MRAASETNLKPSAYFGELGFWEIGHAHGMCGCDEDGVRVEAAKAQDGGGTADG